jgi:cytochrome c oxidase subunit 3
LAPVVSAGFVWPPKGIATLDPISVALFNTMVLLLSGASVTWAHHSLQLGYRNDTILGLALTIGLGVLFTLSQVFEYQSSTFQVNDGIYGSVFFLATGFHGFHVIVGTFFLIVCLYRQINYEFLVKQHFGFEAAAWYWHFVDVV